MLLRAGVVDCRDPVQWHRQDAAVGQFDANVHIVETDAADRRLACERVLRDA